MVRGCRIIRSPAVYCSSALLLKKRVAVKLSIFDLSFVLLRRMDCRMSIVDIPTLNKENTYCQQADQRKRGLKVNTPKAY
jgi:hypothetical protein